MLMKRERLLARRRELLDSLPPLTEIVRGSFFIRHRHCGNPNCRCASGQGHRTAYVTVTFKKGSTEQIALPRALESLAKSWVHNYQRWWKVVEEVSKINRDFLRHRLVTQEK